MTRLAVPKACANTSHAFGAMRAARFYALQQNQAGLEADVVAFFMAEPRHALTRLTLLAQCAARFYALQQNQAGLEADVVAFFMTVPKVGRKSAAHCAEGMR